MTVQGRSQKLLLGGSFTENVVDLMLLQPAHGAGEGLQAASYLLYANSSINKIVDFYLQNNGPF